MLKRLPRLALILGLGVLVGSLLAETPADTKKVAQLIEKLGSADFDEREQASQDLDKLGLPALEALRQAAKSDDAEMRRRAVELVGKIEKREASGILLKPTRVTLALKDAPVADAIESLRKQTNFAIQLNDPANALKDVRLTLDLKDVTFFDALAAVCEKAGLVEGLAAQTVPGVQPAPGFKIRPIRRGPLLPARGVLPAVPEKQAPPRNEQLAVPQAPQTAPAAQPQAAPAPALPPPPPVQAVPIQGGIQIGGGAQIIIGGPAGFAPGMPGGMQTQPSTIVLTPGKFEKLPADTATAFRVRAIPSQVQLRVPGQNVLNTMLEVTPEPRFQWAGHDAITLIKIVDDQDQQLTRFDPNAPVNPGGPNIPANPPPGAGIGIAFPGGFAGGAFDTSTTIPLYFKPGAKPTKSLKELTGTIAAHVLVPHSKPIVADKVMDAPGKSFKGAKGGEIRIIEVTREAEAIRIKFETIPAKDAVGGANQGGPGQFPGGVGPVPGILIPPVRVAPPLPPPAPNPPDPAPAPKPQRPGLAFQVQAQAQVQAAPAQVAQIQLQLRPAMAPIQAWRGGGMMGGTVPDNIRVLDEKGNPIAITIAQQQVMFGPAGNQHVTEVRVLQGKNVPKVASLTWQQQKIASVDIPFTLKDVPVQ